MTEQPPSGGCVLKRLMKRSRLTKGRQPPSGGCVLKQQALTAAAQDSNAAAFGRLCVETLRSGQD